MTATKEELSERAQLVRMFEASCKIDFPSVDEANFRFALMKRIGKAFNFKEVMNMRIDGPVKTAPPRPQK